MRAALLCLAMVPPLLALPRAAEACSWPYNERHQTDPELQDATPPGAVAVGEIELHRYEENGTCAPTGFLRIAVNASDDRPGAVGFQLRVVSGAAPAMLFPTDALRRSPFADGGSLYFIFPYDTPRLQLEVEVRAVDLAGNVGAPTTFMILEAEDAGDGGGGCATTGEAPAPLAALALAGLAGRLARRRSFRR